MQTPAYLAVATVEHVKISAGQKITKLLITPVPAVHVKVTNHAVRNTLISFAALERRRERHKRGNASSALSVPFPETGALGITGQEGKGDVTGWTGDETLWYLRGNVAEQDAGCLPLDRGTLLAEEFVGQRMVASYCAQRVPFSGQAMQRVTMIAHLGLWAGVLLCFVFV